MDQLQRIRDVVARVADSEGLEVVDVELHGRGRGATVRIYLDKPVAAGQPESFPPPGVSLEDCQKVSQQVGMILDVEEIMADSYTLEVSSPGLDRKLVKPTDYTRFAGQLAALELRPEAAGGGPGKIRGRLTGQQDGQISVELEGGETRRLAFSDIARAHLVPEFPKKEKPGKGPRKQR